jgi:enoyl-CoA hydratase
MDFENITYLVEDGIATITIDRPKALNALNSKTLDELCSAAWQAGEDPEVGAVILTGAGDKAFVAGADIKEMIEFSPLDMKEFCLRGQASLATLEELGKPVICAINGFALGGGLELALACDVRIASENAKLGLPEVSLGIIPGFGGTQRLPRLIGPGRAKEMVMSAGMYDAAKAEAWGLVNAVHPSEDLMDAARKMAKAFMRNGPMAVALGKAAVNNGLDMDLKRALYLEAELEATAFSTGDRHEGMGAFVEKRKPEFSGK